MAQVIAPPVDIGQLALPVNEIAAYKEIHAAAFSKIVEEWQTQNLNTQSRCGEA